MTDLFGKIIFGKASHVAMSNYFEVGKQKYIKGFFDFHESAWVEKYDIIKDDSWPTIDSYADFYNLPDFIQKECIDIHEFSPDIWLQCIKNDAAHQYAMTEQMDLSVLPVYRFFADNLDLIENKKILDVGCNFGYWSLFSVKNQALHVIGIDARPELIEISRALQKDYEIEAGKLEFKVCNVHDYESLQPIARGRETLLLLGVMYHFDDHINVLKSMICETILDVVIETTDPKKLNPGEPLIWWMKESSSSYLSGFESDDKKNILVGWPTLSWFDLIFGHMGFERQTTILYNSSDFSADHPDEFLIKRRIIHYKKCRNLKSA